MLDVGTLVTLRAVLAHGSFSAAGQALGLTQPAVSRQITLLERQAGTRLVRRTRQGARPTEAGRLLAGHAEAILDRLALASEQLAELAGLRRGRVRLGAFFTAFAQLTPTVAALTEARLPDLDLEHELVDRRTAFRRLAGDTGLRAHGGWGARLPHNVLAGAGLRPPLMLAGHGDEPVETQVHVVAGDGVALAYELNVIINPAGIAIRPLAGDAPVRHVQAAILRDQRAPGSRALLEVLR